MISENVMFQLGKTLLGEISMKITKPAQLSNLLQKIQYKLPH